MLLLMQEKKPVVLIVRHMADLLCEQKTCAPSEARFLSLGDILHVASVKLLNSKLNVVAGHLWPLPACYHRYFVS
jgi:hypothetical protein